MCRISVTRVFPTKVKAESWTIAHQFCVTRPHLLVLYGPTEPLFLGTLYSDCWTEIHLDQVLPGSGH